MSIATSRSISIAPPGAEFAHMVHFGGALVEARLERRTLDASTIAGRAKAAPPFALVQMLDVGVGWEWQKRANTGLWQQQDPWTLPRA